LFAKDGVQKFDSTIIRLRDFVITLKRPRTTEDFRAELKRQNLGLKMDVRTRWNSTFQMCLAALKIREELDIHWVTAAKLRVLAFSEDWESSKILLN
jgi:hypothetical protein